MTEPAAAPALRWQRAVLREIVRRTERIRSFFLEPEAPFAFRAGQHVHVRLTAEDGYQAQRSYSIASAPERPERIELAIERLADGEVSPYFHDVAAVGDEIELRGPIGGHFVWSVEEGGPIVLVGGGSGIVPLVSMARHRAARAAAAPMLLVASTRSWDDIAFRDELLALERAGDGFSLVLATTRQPARREGDFARRIDRALVAAVLGRLPSAPERVYVCGANAFVEAATTALLDAGIGPARIRTERYGG